MMNFNAVRSGWILAISFAGALVLSGAPAVADSTGAAVLTGVVRAAGNAPVAGASVQVSGVTKASTASDADGHFSLDVAPGVYRVSVQKGGYNTAELGDIVVAPGTQEDIVVALTRVDLSQLRTIGTVTSVGRNASAVNTSTASTSYVSGDAFASLANPQINDVLQRIPDVTIQHMGSQPDTTIIVGGAQPYETQVLMDGHPLALGQYGVWISTYFPSFLIGGVETQTGPGNTTPFANLAVGGTANLITPGFTKQTTFEATSGFDNYQSQYSNFLATGSAGRLAYVVGAGTSGANGPFLGKQGCAVGADNFANDNTPASAGIIEYCGTLAASLSTRGLLTKLRYDFSDTTSFEAGFVGAWGGYIPVAAAYGNSIGPTTVIACLSPPLQLECNNPAYNNLIGQTVNGYTYFASTVTYNNQTIFDAQFRTAIGKLTFLARPYLGSIEPGIINGTLDEYDPYFFSPPGTVPSLGPGQQIPSTGLTNPNAFESTVCPPGNAYSYGQINSPANTIVSVNGQEECFEYPYTTFELDKLYGTTFSAIYPFGDSTANLTYDFHGQNTFAYVNSPGNITVPFSADRHSTISLTGDIRAIHNLGINVGLYDTLWSIAGVQPELSGGTPVLDAYGNPILIGLDRTISRFDPHVGFVFHPSPNVVYRASYGTSTTFPYIGQVSGLASYNPFDAAAPQYTGGTLIEKNPALNPEESIAYGIGTDVRLNRNAHVSLDLVDTTIHDVFETISYGVTTALSQLEAVTAPINVARLRSQTATFKFVYAPPVGAGFNIAAAAERSMVDGLPASVYNDGPGFPVNNVQICGNGLFTPGIPTCIPYLKGYGQFTYAWRNGSFMALGVDYDGVNNAYYQPPFAQLDLTMRHPIGRDFELQLTVQNLLNTNTFTGLAAPNEGVPLVAGATNDGVTQYQTTYLSTLIPAPPRTLRVQLRFHTGR